MSDWMQTKRDNLSQEPKGKSNNTVKYPLFQEIPRKNKAYEAVGIIQSTLQ